ncbi:MAG: hypothetical protein M3297_02850 [Thermoproteota archaeon]|nr:hypothetical protein [Thermoproteota archaeon]
MLNERLLSKKLRMGLITWIIVIIIFLAVLGLGWDTFFAGVKKGADRIGISSLVEKATDNTIEFVNNASRGIIGSSTNILSLINAEGQEQQQPQPQQKQQLFSSSSSNDNDNDNDNNDNGYKYHIAAPAAALIKELENVIRNIEYTFDLEGGQIFPTDEIKQDIVSEYKSSEYNIEDLNYELLGFKITASDIKIHIDPKKIDDTKTRIDIPLLLAKDIKVSNGELINLSYNEVDLGSIYGVYNKATDKITVHVPISIAAKYI